MNEPNWLAEARPIESAEIEVCFPLSRTFYFGPDHVSTMDDPKFQAPLRLPEVPRFLQSLLRSGEALGHESKLADYYKAVVALATKYNKLGSPSGHYFWLRLWIWNTSADCHIGFPWYDTLAEMVPFLTAASSVREGYLFSDGDEGWELEMYHSGGELFLRLRDPDEDETHDVVRFSREPFAIQAQETLARSRRVVSSLIERVGGDHWGLG